MADTFSDTQAIYTLFAFTWPKVCKAPRQEHLRNPDLQVLGWEFQVFHQVPQRPHLPFQTQELTVSQQNSGTLCFLFIHLPVSSFLSALVASTFPWISSLGPSGRT